MWPVPPQQAQITLLVMLGRSGHCQALCPGAPQLEQRGPPSRSFSRRVPLSRASSRSCMRRRSFWPSGTSTPCRIISLILSTALRTLSWLEAVTKAWSGSSSPGRGWPSLRPTLPSFTEPLPRMMILAPVSFSRDLSVFPRGPMSSPTKLMSGCSSCGIITFSLTRISGGL
uniref:Secreted protein n=1 Tax=Ixodes ricinus TaxID=34613 RepID=A0A147BUT5_IXORI